MRQPIHLGSAALLTGARLRDYSALRASSLRGRPGGRSTSLRDVVEPGLFYVGGSTDKLHGGRAAVDNFFCKLVPAEGFEYAR